MLLNAAKCRVLAFTVSELLRENQQVWWGEGVKLPNPTQIRVKMVLPKDAVLIMRIININGDNFKHLRQ